MSSQKKKLKPEQSTQSKVVYQEFGTPPALERSVPNLSPQQQTLIIQASRKGKGGKTVTVISGFQQSPDRLTTLLKQLKSQLGTGGSVKDDTLELQGDRRQQLLPALTQLGYKVKISGG